jgi:hypothetical protein
MVMVYNPFIPISVLSNLVSEGFYISIHKLYWLIATFHYFVIGYISVLGLPELSTTEWMA